MDRRVFLAGSLAAAALPLVRASDFPSRPVRVISPYAAGGGPDVQLRQAGPVLGEILGQSIVIENKVGAAGVLAAQYVAQQPADGYTCLMGSNRSEEHTSELQSQSNLVCRLLLEKKKKNKK